MTSLEGVRLSGPPAHPQVRIKKPAPFARPAVQVGTQDKRDWRHVPASAVSIGDTVPGLGTIRRIRTLAGQVHLDGGEDSRATYRPGELVLAFTAAPAAE